MRFANNIDQFNFFSGFIDDNVRDTERDFEQKLDEMFDETRIKNTKFSERLENFGNGRPKGLVKDLIIISKWD